jgi:hypothetical protein
LHGNMERCQGFIHGVENSIQVAAVASHSKWY